MNRRLFYIALGATAGVLIVARLSRAARQFTPAGVQSSVAGAMGNLGDALRGFTAEVRAGMSEREDELRRGLGLDGSHDLVDSPGSTGGLEDDVR